MGNNRVLVLFGGVSPEHEVSCSSAASLLDSLAEGGYETCCVGITKEGEWLYTEAPSEMIKDARQWLAHPSNKKSMIDLDGKKKALLLFDGDRIIERKEVDVAFPMMHGEDGEDGHMQGLLEIAGIPYVGSDTCSSACCMDKIVSMKFADMCGLAHPHYFYCDVDEYLNDPSGTVDRIVAYFDSIEENCYPLFVKPASTGSSIGISKVNAKEELPAALDLASTYKGRLIIEQGIVGREIKVAVLGNKAPQFGDICEISIGGEVFNDYTTKYSGTGSHKKIPADIPADLVETILRDAALIYAELGCSGFARVDFFLTDGGQVVFNEINTIPGFSHKSIYPLMFQSKGVSYNQLVDKLIDCAFE